MKTAMQELIEYIEEFQPKNKQTTGIWSKAKSLLETEKQHIIDAYNSSSWETDKDIEGHHYYDIKFKNKNPLM